MKKLILLALAFVMCGCSELTTTRAYENDNETVYYVKKVIYIVDSCEYLIRGSEYTHKGNCKFCAERRKKELEELIRKIKEQ